MKYYLELVQMITSEASFHERQYSQYITNLLKYPRRSKLTMFKMKLKYYRKAKLKGEMSKLINENKISCTIQLHTGWFNAMAYIYHWNYKSTFQDILSKIVFYLWSTVLYTYHTCLNWVTFNTHRLFMCTI